MIRPRTQQIMRGPKVSEADAAPTKSLELWRFLGLNVTPKVHLLEDHFVQFAYKNAECLHGLAQFVEQCVERFHQEGELMDQRSKNRALMIEAKFQAYSRLRHAENHPEVTEEMSQVEESRKRQFFADSTSRRELN